MVRIRSQNGTANFGCATPVQSKAPNAESRHRLATVDASKIPGDGVVVLPQCRTLDIRQQGALSAGLRIVNHLHGVAQHAVFDVVERIPIFKMQEVFIRQPPTGSPTLMQPATVIPARGPCAQGFAFQMIQHAPRLIDDSLQLLDLQAQVDVLKSIAIAFIESFRLFKDRTPDQHAGCGDTLQLTPARHASCVGISSRDRYGTAGTPPRECDDRHVESCRLRTAACCRRPRDVRMGASLFHQGRQPSL